MSEASAFVSIRTTPATGRARRRELAEQAEAERLRIEAELLHDLGRPPSAADRIAVETISATTIRARRLRSDGRSDAEERKLIAQLMRATGLRPAPVEPQKAAPQSLQDWWQTANAEEGGGQP